jgi:hypothetical protein
MYVDMSVSSHRDDSWVFFYPGNNDVYVYAHPRLNGRTCFFSRKSGKVVVKLCLPVTKP